MNFKNLLNLGIMIHPGKKLIEEIRNRNRTQKQFAILVGKKNSELNELIKGKRNITIQWDYALSQILGTPEKYWINMQTDYDYEIMKEQKEKEEKLMGQQFEVIEDVPENTSDVEEGDLSTKLDSNIDENGTKSPETSVSETEAETIDTKDQENKQETQRKEAKKIFMNF